MSVYTPAPENASGCASPGCRCPGRRPAYPSDLSDAEWAVLEGETVAIVKRSDDMRGFVVLPRRWVVERSFAWLMRYRRLVRIYERKPEHHEALIWWAAIHQMTRRLARELAGQPPHGRWSDPPPLPELTSPDRRGRILELLAAQPWRTWRGTELAAILGIDNVNSFRVQRSQWSHQGYINKLGPALYGPIPTSTYAFVSRLLQSQLWPVKDVAMPAFRSRRYANGRDSLVARRGTDIQ